MKRTKRQKELDMDSIAHALDDREKQTVWNALANQMNADAERAKTMRKAAEENAAPFGEGAKASALKLADTFAKQANEARALLEFFEP